MLLKNGTVFLPGRVFRTADVAVRGDQIVSSVPGTDPVLDCTGKLVLPGLIDLHVHGAAGADFCDGDPASLETIARYEASQGVTSFLGTSMSVEKETLLRAFRAAGAFLDGPAPGGAVLRGTRMEGPFLSPQKCGAQDPDCCIPFDRGLFEELNDACGGRIRIVDLAPEIPENLAAIPPLSRTVRVSLAHTAADYETACRAAEAGASHVTHLFNGMNDLLHREPGVPGAVMDRKLTAELICDGIHVHPALIRAAFRMLGADHICLISDSTSAAGMPDGSYALGGTPIIVKNGCARLADGTLAGSAVCLTECLRRAVSFGIPLKDAVLSCTEVPARAAGIWEETGSVEEGKRADLLILNEDLSVFAVMTGGRLRTG